MGRVPRARRDRSRTQCRGRVPVREEPREMGGAKQPKLLTVWGERGQQQKGGEFVHEFEGSGRLKEGGRGLY